MPTLIDMEINPKEKMNQESVKEFLLEDSALKRLKLREQVYYPNLSPFRHKGTWAQIIGGALLCASTAFTESPSWIQPAFGIPMILLGMFIWQQEEAKSIHERISKLLELQSSDSSTPTSHIQSERDNG